ncbi:MAG TPA: glutamate racemase [Chitinophagaceae bacterium]|jgi:glutamate racemase|nr:glutamate racemase [Chitinophagaceae bacterium]
MKPIGVFDSGYGGLTVLRSLVDRLPQYDYLYLGDNARAPYGPRSFDTVYRYTLQCVEWLLGQGCPLVILACNTASAKALRSIQQKDLEHLDPQARVLGVIRPTTEVVGNLTRSKSIGILATRGTVQSRSYEIEIGKFFPEVHIEQEACPMWVPLVENNEHGSAGADYFIRQHVNNILSRDPRIDTVLLACTHYPLLQEKIRACLPPGVTLLTQGGIVAESLQDYLARHPEIETRISRESRRRFYTTDAPEDFNEKATTFFGEEVAARHAEL